MASASSSIAVAAQTFTHSPFRPLRFVKVMISRRRTRLYNFEGTNKAYIDYLEQKLKLYETPTTSNFAAYQNPPVPNLTSTAQGRSNGTSQTPTPPSQREEDPLLAHLDSFLGEIPVAGKWKEKDFTTEQKKWAFAMLVHAPILPQGQTTDWKPFQVNRLLSEDPLKRLEEYALQNQRFKSDERLTKAVRYFREVVFVSGYALLRNSNRYKALDADQVIMEQFGIARSDGASKYRLAGQWVNETAGLMVENGWGGRAYNAFLNYGRSIRSYRVFGENRRRAVKYAAEHLNRPEYVGPIEDEIIPFVIPIILKFVVLEGFELAEICHHLNYREKATQAILRIWQKHPVGFYIRLLAQQEECIRRRPISRVIDIEEGDPNGTRSEDTGVTPGQYGRTETTEAIERRMGSGEPAPAPKRQRLLHYCGQWTSNSTISQVTPAPSDQTPDRSPTTEGGSNNVSTDDTPSLGSDLAVGMNPDQNDGRSNSRSNDRRPRPASDGSSCEHGGRGEAAGRLAIQPAEANEVPRATTHDGNTRLPSEGAALMAEHPERVVLRVDDDRQQCDALAHAILGDSEIDQDLTLEQNTGQDSDHETIEPTYIRTLLSREDFGDADMRDLGGLGLGLFGEY
ncbi:hypothetical protein CC80DRAFT_511287 [Byssothecium circinans]|uniref:Uncharacterized protein n=1 Tax=Byssothecium circinans TaxID=147558 RepID=A0A6A5T8H8_9PLEO|nr:hypothetical protein CC80DRAFT_511287 [Byssothecium circinans]